MSWPGAFDLPAPEGANGRALAVFRPEDVTLTRDGGASGRVDVRVFLGATTRLHVDVGGTSVAVDLPSRDAAAIAVGETVRLRVAESTVRLFPA